MVPHLDWSVLGNVVTVWKCISQPQICPVGGNLDLWWSANHLCHSFFEETKCTLKSWDSNLAVQAITSLWSHRKEESATLSAIEGNISFCVYVNTATLRIQFYEIVLERQGKETACSRLLYDLGHADNLSKSHFSPSVKWTSCILRVVLTSGRLQFINCRILASSCLITCLWYKICGVHLGHLLSTYWVPLSPTFYIHYLIDSSQHPSKVYHVLSFYRGGNWGSERLRNLCLVTELVSCKAAFEHRAAQL